MPQPLPSRLTHVSDPGYSCFAISADGATIALATLGAVDIFPACSPGMPAAKLIFSAEVDTYNRDMQSTACTAHGTCGICAELAQPPPPRGVSRGIKQVTFYGQDDEYLVALGNGTIAIYDLMQGDCNPIITVSIDCSLETTGKVCLYVANIERQTLATERTGLGELSCIELIINDRRGELNYYRVVFNDRKRWWYIDCNRSVNLVANIRGEDYGIGGLAPTGNVKGQATGRDGTGVTSQHSIRAIEKSKTRTNTDEENARAHRVIVQGTHKEQAHVGAARDNADEVFVVFGVIQASMANEQVVRRVISEYPLTGDGEPGEAAVDLNGDNINGKRITITYNREVVIAAVCRPGCVELFQITVQYSSQAAVLTGDILEVKSKEPTVRLIIRSPIGVDMKVENVLCTDFDRGYIAMLGGDTTAIFRCPLQEMTYNFGDVAVRDGAVHIASYTDTADVSVTLLFTHQERATNVVSHRVGCFGLCDGQCVLVTNAKAGLKIFAVVPEVSGKFLRLAVHYTETVAFGGMTWVPNSVDLAMIWHDGTFAVLSTHDHRTWHTLIPNFSHVRRNTEYIEKEGEFDLQAEALYKPIERKIDYDKLHKTPRCKFFYRIEYALVGGRGRGADKQWAFNGEPTIHSDSMLGEYAHRLAL